jgi:cell wall-associated NlpC family hydrolase
MKYPIFFAVFLLIFLMNSKTFAAGIEIEDERATPEYWMAKNPDGDKLLFTYKQIDRLNAEILERDDYAADLMNYPETITADNLRAKIAKITDDIRLIGSQAVMANRNLNELQYDINVQYAVTTERVNIRLLPQPPTGEKFDKIQGTALDPAEPVAVLWESKDGKFSFVQAKYYFGWVNKNSLAFTDRETWKTYIEPEKFLVVMTNKKFVNVNGKIILFQMGAKIPLQSSALENNFWVARLPIAENGNLKEVSAKVLNDENVGTDYLQPTKNNLIRQSFKFLGNVYGWGGLENSVDCSSLVQNVYRSIGIFIPRDADRQAGCVPIFSVFNDVTRAERVDIVRRAPVGSLLLMPTHVMMKLGNDESGTPIIIHAIGGSLRKVIVSNLNFSSASGALMIDRLTDIAFPR